MKKRKILFTIIFVLFLVSISTVPAFAVTEGEVQAQVDAIGKDGVTGNILVWFLCAIAFLKVSQKIDSFMSSLGINVGHTGGSMMAEALVAARGISLGKNIIGGGKGFWKGGGSGSSSSNNTSLFKGGLSGIVSRKINNNAVQNANGNKQGGLGGKAFRSSMAKGGGFANRVIGSIATGDIHSMGTISGSNAGDALMSYMGYAALGDSASDVPSFSDVEMGGGRILATEVSTEHPEGIAMSMYAADQYDKPDTHYETVTTTDGATWYKQYAVDTIEQHPYSHPDGYIDRGETIVKKLPKAPKRKDR